MALLQLELVPACLERLTEDPMTHTLRTAMDSTRAAKDIVVHPLPAPAQE